MPYFLCTKCDLEFEATAGAWGLAKCPGCKVNANTVGLSPAKRQARANMRVNARHPVVGPERVVSTLLGFLDERGLGLAALVCSRWAGLVPLLLERFVPPMQAFGSMSGPLKNVLVAPGHGLLTGVKSLKLAVDQFPSQGFKPKGDSVLNYILKHQIKIDLLLGTQDAGTKAILLKAQQQVCNVTQFAKMHNKIWVLDGSGVVLGSPNVSFSGLEGRNVESFIHIKSPRLGALFTKYLEMLKLDHRSPQYGKLFQMVGREMSAYNLGHHRLKVAVAPVFNITDFIAENLEGAVKIVVRQFLVSHKHHKDRGPGLDIVDVLCRMAEKGVEIEIVLDHGAYQSQAFVRDAVTDLLRSGCKVYTQEPVLVVDTTSECLMHDKLILATLHKGVKRTLIGSAGFTSNVIANENAECFVSTDVDSVFDTLLQHHTLAQEKHKTVRWTLK
jgi:hypothetical protein